MGNDQFIAAQHGESFFYATDIKLGAYTLSHRIVHRIKNDIALKDITRKVYDEFYVENAAWIWKFGYIYQQNMQNQEGKSDETKASVGDVRIKWTAIDLTGYSATFLGVASRENELNGFVASNGDEYIWLSVGRTDSLSDIIISFREDISGKLFEYRIVSLFAMCFGFVCTSQLINYIASFIPICGSLIGCSLNLLACFVGLMFWSLFFLISYLFARKDVAIALIAVIVIGLLIMQQKGTSDKEEKNE